MNELALFAGAGGGLLASLLLGWRTVCAVEIDPYCRSRLLDRQRDGCLSRFPIWDDIRTFDGHPWRGHVDVVSGGFPCQDISAAGQGRGISGARSGLVFEMLRIVDEIRPSFVFAENSPRLRTKGLAAIVEEFIRLGYVGRVGVLGAGDIGANHERKRMWIVAVDRGTRGSRGKIPTHTDDLRGLQPQGVVEEFGRWPDHRIAEDAHTDSGSLWEQQRGRPGEDRKISSVPGFTDWWTVPRFAGVDDGLADRVDRRKATGNGQVPGVAAFAWSVLTSDLKCEPTSGSEF